MGLFRKNDELFELMGQPSPNSPRTGSTHRLRPRASRAPSPRPPAPRPAPTSGFGPRRTDPSAGFGRPGPESAAVPARGGVSGTFGRLISGGLGRTALFGRNKPALEDEVVMVDGEAVIVVEDGWEMPEEGPGRTFPVRLDSMVVGTLVMAGLVVASFLYGRTSAGPVQTAEADPQAQEASADPAAQQEPVQLAGPAAQTPPQTLTPAAPVPQPSVPAAAEQSSAPGAVAAGLRRNQASTVAASAPKQGKYLLVVCNTTPDSAQALVKWLQTNATSPIFGRGDLEPFARGGSVRIRGFQERDKDVLRRVQGTHDPLGGSGTFHDAFYRKG